jgi:hypothetical protein
MLGERLRGARDLGIAIAGLEYRCVIFAPVRREVYFSATVYTARQSRATS